MQEVVSLTRTLACILNRGGQNWHKLCAAPQALRPDDATAAATAAPPPLCRTRLCARAPPSAPTGPRAPPLPPGGGGQETGQGGGQGRPGGGRVTREGLQKRRMSFKREGTGSQVGAITREAVHQSRGANEYLLLLLRPAHSATVPGNERGAEAQSPGRYACATAAVARLCAAASGRVSAAGPTAALSCPRVLAGPAHWQPASHRQRRAPPQHSCRSCKCQTEPSISTETPGSNDTNLRRLEPRFPLESTRVVWRGIACMNGIYPGASCIAGEQPLRSGPAAQPRGRHAATAAQPQQPQAFAARTRQASTRGVVQPRVAQV